MKFGRVFGYGFPTRFEVLGIRFIDGEGGGAPAAPVPTPPAPPVPAQDETDWKAEARKWEARAKDNTNAAARLAEIEESAKTDLQRARDEAERAKAEAAAAKVEAMRAKVANAKGIPEDLLTGTTQEDLEASADKLLAFRGEQAPPAPTKQSYIIPDEGGVPAIGKEDNITPGMGTLRAAYSQASN